MMITAISTPSTTIVSAAMALASPLTADAALVAPLTAEEHQPYDNRGSYAGASWLAVSATELASRLEAFAADVIGYADRETRFYSGTSNDGSYAVGGSVSVGSKDASRWLNGPENSSGTLQKIAEQEKNLQNAFAALHSRLPNADRDLIEEAAPFFDLIKDLDWQPNIWSDEGEVAFEWKTPEKHAIVSFDGDGYYGYAMLVNDRFRAGAQDMPLANTIPSDLKDYLSVA